MVIVIMLPNSDSERERAVTIYHREDAACLAGRVGPMQPRQGDWIVRESAGRAGDLPLSVVG
jgi:hypothetical protein